ncbi:hypothetical protein C0Q70_12848 [Pomacea canaliculata]|uniref:Ig-like domain-containing protein n=1 Tax=Pomacea canaliculata TaxID=400727 RepID=A0A2T7P2P5_POMCA|nr:hypothetical protein C0Q70_12848 [Pomacea canaliculata]
MLPRIQVACLMTVIFFLTSEGVIIDNCDNEIRIVSENTPIVLSCGEIAEGDANTWCDFEMIDIAICYSADIPIPTYPETIDPKDTSQGQLEPFKVALIVVASVIAAGLLVTVIIVFIKRKGNIYHQTTQMNDEHPYTIIFTGQHVNPFARSVQENELQPVYMNIPPHAIPRSLFITNGWRWTWQEGYIAIAGIAFASVIIVGIIVAVTVVCIKRIGDVYDKTTRTNFNEHPYMNGPASQKPTDNGHSVQGVVITCLVILYSVCGAEGIKLRNCNKTDGSTDLHEPIICEGISSNGSVVWYHQYKGVLAQCSVDGNCSTSYSDDYNITREANSTVSQLRILKGGTEDHGVVISCDDRNNNSRVNRKAGDFGYSWDNDNTACNDKCYRGKCSLEWQLPQEKGNYIITVTVIGSTKTAFSQVISNDDTCKTFSTVPLTSVSHGATTPSKESLPSEAKNHPVIIIVIVLVAITALIIASVIFFVIFRRRRQQKFEDHINEVYQCADLLTSQPRANT